LLRQAAPLMMGRGASAVITLAIPMVLARLLRPAEFGLYKQAFLVTGTATLLLQMGLAQSLYYFLPRARARGERLRYLQSTVALLAVLAVAGGLALGSAGSLLERGLHSPELRGLAPWLGAYCGFMVLGTPLEITFIAHRQPWRAAVLFLSSDLVRTAAMLLPLLLGGGVHGLMMGATSHAALRALAVAVVLVRPSLLGPSPDRAGSLGDGGAGPEGSLTSGSPVQQILAYALPFGGAAVFVVLQQQWHQYAVAIAVPAATFAVYAVGCFNLPVVDLVYTPVVEVLMVRLGEARGGRSEKSLAVQLFHEAVERLAVVFFPLMFVLQVVAVDLITGLFTSTYRAAVPIFVVGTLELVHAVFPADGVLRAWAQTRFLLWANVIRLLLTVVLVAIGLRPGGIAGLIGALAGYVVAQMAIKVLLLWRCKTVLGVSWSRWLPWRALGRLLLMAAGSAAAGLAVQQAMVRAGLPALWRAGVAVATCALVQGSVVLWLGRHRTAGALRPE
jgi:O-antigen/teichoic acid export membrane protein